MCGCGLHSFLSIPTLTSQYLGELCNALLLVQLSEHERCRQDHFENSSDGVLALRGPTSKIRVSLGLWLIVSLLFSWSMSDRSH